MSSSCIMLNWVRYKTMFILLLDPEFEQRQLLMNIVCQDFVSEQWKEDLSSSMRKICFQCSMKLMEAFHRDSNAAHQKPTKSSLVRSSLCHKYLLSNHFPNYLGLRSKVVLGKADAYRAESSWLQQISVNHPCAWVLYCRQCSIPSRFARAVFKYDALYWQCMPRHHLSNSSFVSLNNLSPCAKLCDYRIHTWKLHLHCPKYILQEIFLPKRAEQCVSWWYLEQCADQQTWD